MKNYSKVIAPSLSFFISKCFSERKKERREEAINIIDDCVATD